MNYKTLRQESQVTHTVLSSENDVEFMQLEKVSETLKRTYAKLQTASESSNARVKEYKKLVPDYEEKLVKQERKMKINEQQRAELQAKLADIGCRLEKSHDQLKVNLEKVNQYMRQKESLMIADENNESDSEAAVVDSEAKFYAVTSCIRWDVDADFHEIRGCLVEPHKAHVFDFDRREKSLFYICNKLWEMMEPSAQWKDLLTEQSKVQPDAEYRSIVQTVCDSSLQLGV